jgi:hypothetical protein
MKPQYTPLLILLGAAAFLFLVNAYADYEYQASMHGWNALLDLSHRAPKWGLFDFIPHDAWHLVQSIRNQSAIAATACAAIPLFILAGEIPWLNRRRSLLLAGMVIGCLLLYGAARAVGFTLVYEVLN